MSKTLIICHVVFSTKGRRNTLNPIKCRSLYEYLYGILRKNNCWVYRINGMMDHVHILFDLNANIALAGLMKELTQSSSVWLSRNIDFPQFHGWNGGYFAVSVSPQDLESVRNYILNQQTHHLGRAYLDEIEEMVKKSGMKWHADDW